MPGKSKRPKKPKTRKLSKLSKRLRHELRTRRFYGPDRATVVKMANLVAVNGHPCMTWFWGASGTYLASLLPPVGSETGFACSLPAAAYDTLLKAQRRIELALGAPPARPKPWVGGVPDATDIAGAAGIFLFDLDGDRDDFELPDHHTAGAAGWIFTGVMENGSDLALQSHLGRIKNALGSA
jgi:hypothetical protein